MWNFAHLRDTRLLIALALLLLAVAGASAGQLDASWTAPTTNTDGSPLTDLASYRVYWYLYPNTPCPGTQFLVVTAPATTAHLAGLTKGFTYNVQATAVNARGVESACSTIASAVARADVLVDFAITGIAQGQSVGGPIRVNAVPADGSTANNHFRFDLLNAAGVSVKGNDEFKPPYCFVGDPGALPCAAFDTTKVPDGAYTLRVTYMPPAGSASTKVVGFTIANCRCP